MGVNTFPHRIPLPRPALPLPLPQASHEEAACEAARPARGEWARRRRRRRRRGREARGLHRVAVRLLVARPQAEEPDVHDQVPLGVQVQGGGVGRVPGVVESTKHLPTYLPTYLSTSTYPVVEVLM